MTRSQPSKRVKVTIPSNEEYRALGLGRHIVDRPSHPQLYVSSWPLSYGLQAIGNKSRYRQPHLNYNSVMVTTIGNHYDEGVWWRLQNMLRYTEEQGFLVALEELDDMSMMPTDAIGIMRGAASKLALDAGFEWCFMVDTDVLLEEDTLIRLLHRDAPVVFPYLNVLKDFAPGAPISSPRLLQSGMGMQPVRWAAMSCMLFYTKVFNCLDHYAWHGHDAHFSQSLSHFGHRIYVDTDTVVDVTKGPTRHSMKDWDTMLADMKRAHDSFQIDERDRRPPPNWDSAFDKGYVDEGGVYWGIEQWSRFDMGGPLYFGAQNGAQVHRVNGQGERKEETNHA